ncbi:MAG: putative phosphopantetheinyl transferase [Bacteroidota bacterium]
MNFETLLSKLTVQLSSAQLDSIIESSVFLFPAEKIQLQNRSSEKRRKEFLGARLLRNQLLIKSIISYDDVGKPYLQDDPNRYISISHSGETVVLGVASFNIGIDIEKPQNKIHRIINKFADEDEKNLYSFSQFSATDWLTFIWCAKEAIYKLGGRKGVAFKEEIQLLSIDEVEHNYLKISGSYKHSAGKTHEVEVYCLKDSELLFALAKFKAEP